MFNELIKRVKRFHYDEQGGDIVQTAIIIGIFAALSIAGLIFLGPKVKDMFDKTGAELDKGIEGMGEGGIIE